MDERIVGYVSGTGKMHEVPPSSARLQVSRNKDLVQVQWPLGKLLFARDALTALDEFVEGTLKSGWHNDVFSTGASSLWGYNGRPLHVVADQWAGSAVSQPGHSLRALYDFLARADDPEDAPLRAPRATAFTPATTVQVYGLKETQVWAPFHGAARVFLHKEQAIAGNLLADVVKRTSVGIAEYQVLTLFTRACEQ